MNFVKAFKYLIPFRRFLGFLWSLILLILILYLIGVFTDGDNFLKRLFNLKEAATNISLQDLKDKKEELQEKYHLGNYLKSQAKLLVDHQIESFEAKKRKIELDLTKTVEEKQQMIAKIKQEHNYDVYQEKIKRLAKKYQDDLEDCNNSLNKFINENKQKIENLVAKDKDDFKQDCK